MDHLTFIMKCFDKQLEIVSAHNKLLNSQKQVILKQNVTSDLANYGDASIVRRNGRGVMVGLGVRSERSSAYLSKVFNCTAPVRKSYLSQEMCPENQVWSQHCQTTSFERTLCYFEFSKYYFSCNFKVITWTSSLSPLISCLLSLLTRPFTLSETIHHSSQSIVVYSGQLATCNYNSLGIMPKCYNFYYVRIVDTQLCDIYIETLYVCIMFIGFS